MDYQGPCYNGWDSQMVSYLCSAGAACGLVLRDRRLRHCRRSPPVPCCRCHTAPSPLCVALAARAVGATQSDAERRSALTFMYSRPLLHGLCLLYIVFISAGHIFARRLSVGGTAQRPSAAAAERRSGVAVEVLLPAHTATRRECLGHASHLGELSGDPACATAYRLTHGR